MEENIIPLIGLTVICVFGLSLLKIICDDKFKTKVKRLVIVNLTDNTILFDITGEYKLIKRKHSITIEYVCPDHSKQIYVFGLNGNITYIETTNVSDCCIVLSDEQINSQSETS